MPAVPKLLLPCYLPYENCDYLTEPQCFLSTIKF